MEVWFGSPTGTDAIGTSAGQINQRKRPDMAMMTITVPPNTPDCRRRTCGPLVKVASVLATVLTGRVSFSVVSPEAVF